MDLVVAADPAQNKLRNMCAWHAEFLSQWQTRIISRSFGSRTKSSSCLTALLETANTDFPVSMLCTSASRRATQSPLGRPPKNRRAWMRDISSTSEVSRGMSSIFEIFRSSSALAAMPENKTTASLLRRTSPSWNTGIVSHRRRSLLDLSTKRLCRCFLPSCFIPVTAHSSVDNTERQSSTSQVNVFSSADSSQQKRSVLPPRSLECFGM